MGRKCLQQLGQNSLQQQHFFTVRSPKWLAQQFCPNSWGKSVLRHCCSGIFILYVNIFYEHLVTGSRFGLTLTLNIEQYEYMVGPNTDAGIKVRHYCTLFTSRVSGRGNKIGPVCPCFRPPVSSSALSWPNRLTYGHQISYRD